MKKYVILMILMNLILGISYLWGAENNRMICVALWFVFPILNLFLFGLFETQFNEEF